VGHASKTRFRKDKSPHGQVVASPLSPQKLPVPNLCHWQFNTCHIGSYFIHSMPYRIDLHPNILSSYLSYVKQHVLLRPITYAREIEHPIRIDGILPASAHMKSP
jgi:hypothetical protein